MLLTALCLKPILFEVKRSLKFIVKSSFIILTVAFIGVFRRQIISMVKESKLILWINNKIFLSKLINKELIHEIMGMKSLYKNMQLFCNRMNAIPNVVDRFEHLMNYFNVDIKTHDLSTSNMNNDMLSSLSKLPKDEKTQCLMPYFLVNKIIVSDLFTPEDLLKILSDTTNSKNTNPIAYSQAQSIFILLKNNPKEPLRKEMQTYELLLNRSMGTMLILSILIEKARDPLSKHNFGVEKLNLFFRSSFSEKLQIPMQINTVMDPRRIKPDIHIDNKTIGSWNIDMKDRLLLGNKKYKRLIAFNMLSMSIKMMSDKFTGKDVEEFIPKKVDEESQDYKESITSRILGSGWKMLDNTLATLVSKVLLLRSTKKDEEDEEDEEEDKEKLGRYGIDARTLYKVREDLVTFDKDFPYVKPIAFVSRIGEKLMEPFIIKDCNPEYIEKLRSHNIDLKQLEGKVSYADITEELIEQSLWAGCSGNYKPDIDSIIKYVKEIGHKNSDCLISCHTILSNLEEDSKQEADKDFQNFLSLLLSSSGQEERVISLLKERHLILPEQSMSLTLDSVKDHLSFMMSSFKLKSMFLEAININLYRLEDKSEEIESMDIGVKEKDFLMNCNESSLSKLNDLYTNIDKPVVSVDDIEASLRNIPVSLAMCLYEFNSIFNKDTLSN